MAIVKNPLHSMSARGSIGKTLTYVPMRRTAGQRIPRVILGREVMAIYTGETISGQAIVKKAISKRADQGRISREPDGENASRRKQLRRTIRESSRLANWIVRNNIAVADSNPETRIPIAYPWAERRYLQRGEQREFLQFPGQEKGQTVSVRTRITGTTTRPNFIMRQLVTGRMARLLITELYFYQQTPELQNAWTPQGNAPWDELNLPVMLMGNRMHERNFLNCWMQAACVIPEFTLPRGWIENPRRLELWTSPHHYPDTGKMVMDWKEWLSSENDYRVEATRPWEKES